MPSCRRDAHRKKWQTSRESAGRNDYNQRTRALYKLIWAHPLDFCLELFLELTGKLLMNYCPSRRVVLLCACSLPLLLALGCGPARGQWTSSRASHVSVLPEDAESWTFEATEGRIIETDHYRG